MIISTERRLKADKLGKSIAKDLNDIVDLYFNNYDEKKFEATNLHWKKHCYNINNRQQLVKAEPEAFKNRVAKIISENPQFQNNVIDFTKL